MSNTPDATADRQAILAREEARAQALIAGDVERLSELMADDLVHVHASGRVENKAVYLEGVRSRFRFQSVHRPRLDVRVFGDTAIVTGPLEQRLTSIATGEKHAMQAYATQVWVRQGSTWRQASFQATNVPPAA